MTNVNESVITEARRLECELDGMYFNRYFFKQQFGTKMIVSDHHNVIQQSLDKVIECDIKRLIINVPPGYSKTLMAVIDFIARGLALNSGARFLHLSYADDLALENSTSTKGLIESDEFQAMWNIKLKDDSKSKKKWWTTAGGGVYATSAGGQVTGFRAGYMNPGFTGALIIDDPVKPDDAFTVELEKVNNRFNNTIKSRLCTEDIPIIVIMQRIHENDLSGYLLRGGSGEMWHHLNLPVVIDNNDVYPEKYTHGIEIKHNLPNGWLWEFKHNEKHRLALMSHKRTWFSQYKQKPEEYDIEGALWSSEIINKHRVHKIPDGVELIKVATGVDPSGDDGKNKDKKADAIGIITCFIGSDNHYYVITDDTLNGSPATWGKKCVDVYKKHSVNNIIAEKNFGGAMVEHTILSMSESKGIKVKLVTSSRGKLLRAEPISALYEQGLVHHVGNFSELELEMETYNGIGKSPNRLDALVFALTELSSGCTDVDIW